MSVYTVSHRLKNRDVSLFRRLRTSRLLEMMQEASIAHTEALHMGRTMTLDKGLLWVVVQQKFEIARMPEYDETVVIETWPGKTRHVLFPRYYRLLSEKGEVLAEGSALWMLVKETDRKMVFPAKHGITIDEVITGNETELPSALHPDQPDREETIKVRYSWCDLNGHMNNTKYLDLCEDLADSSLLERPLKKIETEYAAEVRYQDEVHVTWHCDESSLTVSGRKEKNCFRIRLEYA